MTDFPWQKKDDNGSNFDWDRRMPWDKPSPDDDKPEAPDNTDAADTVAERADGTGSFAGSGSVGDEGTPDDSGTPDGVGASETVEMSDPVEVPISEVAPEPYAAHEAGSLSEPGVVSEAVAASWPGADALGLPEPYLPPASPDEGVPPLPHAMQARPAAPPVPPRGSATSPKPAPSRRAGALVIGLFVAILVVTGIAIGLVQSRDARVDVPALEQSEKSDATTVVLDFFDAIAAGDADAAMAQSTVPDPDGTRSWFLTDEVLQASQEFAPISNVHVESVERREESAFIATATVSYLLGDDAVTIALPLRDDTDRGWLVDLRDYTMTLPAYWEPDTRVDMFGEPVTGEEQYYFFPGRYPLEVVDSMPVSFLETDGINVTGPTTASVEMPRGVEHMAILVDATNARADEFWDIVEPSLRDCLTSKEPTTPCSSPENASYAADDLVPGTVVRTVSEDYRANVPMSYASKLGPRALVAIASIQVEYTARCADGSTCKGWEFTLYPAVHYAGETPTVTWESLDDD